MKILCGIIISLFIVIYVMLAWKHEYGSDYYYQMVWEEKTHARLLIFVLLASIWYFTSAPGAESEQGVSGILASFLFPIMTVLLIELALETMFGFPGPFHTLK